jgi:S1-C subfamily serine protease
MKYPYFLPAFMIGTIATVNVVPHEITLAQNRPNINNIAKPVTVKIDGLAFGTGVIVNRQGNTYTVLTNWHVVGHGGRNIITTSDNQTHNVSNVRQINKLDLAIIQFTSNKTYQIANIANQPLTVSTPIYITGYPAPRPGIEERIYLYTEGSISGIKSQDANGYTLVYSNDTRPGMSGSPIFNSEGKLVGIHGQSEGTKVINPQTGTTEIRPATIGGLKLGIPIKVFVNIAPSFGINLQTNNFNSSPNIDRNIFESQNNSNEQTSTPTRPTVIIPNPNSNPICSGTVCE